MDNIPIWGVILSAVAAMIIGMIWYSDAMFGKQWAKITGTSKSDRKKQMPVAISILIVVSLLTAYVLAHFIIYIHRGTDNGWVEAGFKTAIWAWAGISLTTILAHGVFDKRDKNILWINAGNRLVTLVAMGLILGAFFK